MTADDEPSDMLGKSSGTAQGAVVQRAAPSGTAQGAAVQRTTAGD
jgi:hypothetical protein